MFNNFYHKHIQPGLGWFKQAVTEPRHQLDRTERFVRYCYELGVHGWKALRRDNAPQMASALSFRTMFALLPVLVVSTVVIKNLRGPREFESLTSQLIHALGMYGIESGSIDSVTGEPTTMGDVVYDWVSRFSTANI